MAAQSRMVSHSHSGMPLHIQSALQEKRGKTVRGEKDREKGMKSEGGGSASIQNEQMGRNVDVKS